MSIIIQEQAHINAPQQLVFEVIYALENYHLFIPWCKEAGYIDNHTTAKTRNAYITFAFGPMHYRLDTQNTITAPELVMLTLVAGPVKDLSGTWSIQALDEHSCQAQVDMSFAWKNILLQKTLGKAFHAMCRELVYAFKQRAETLHNHNSCE